MHTFKTPARIAMTTSLLALALLGGAGSAHADGYWGGYVAPYPPAVVWARPGINVVVPYGGPYYRPYPYGYGYGHEWREHAWREGGWGGGDGGWRGREGGWRGRDGGGWRGRD